MEIKIGSVILNQQTINTPFKCSCSGPNNTKPLNPNEPTSGQTQNGVMPNTLTITFSVPPEKGSIIEEIEDLRQADETIDISSDIDFHRSIKFRKVRTVKIVSFLTSDSLGPNAQETPCTLVLLQQNSPAELADISTDENISTTPSDPASGFSIAETIAYQSSKQKETAGLFLG